MSAVYLQNHRPASKQVFENFFLLRFAQCKSRWKGQKRLSSPNTTEKQNTPRHLTKSAPYKKISMLNNRDHLLTLMVFIGNTLDYCSEINE